MLAPWRWEGILILAVILLAALLAVVGALAGCRAAPTRAEHEQWLRGVRLLAVQAITEQDGFWFDDEQTRALARAVESQPPGVVPEWGWWMWSAGGGSVTIDVKDEQEPIYNSRKAEGGRLGVRVVRLEAASADSAGVETRRLIRITTDRVAFEERRGGHVITKSTDDGPTLLSRGDGP